MIKKRSLFILLILTFILMLSGCEKSLKNYTPKAQGLTSYQDTGNSRIYYEIFVGGFSDSNKDGIGDLKGLINRLDYLNDGDSNSGKSLGVEGLWLMPIMKAGSYHKYDTIDYMTVDGRYGTNDDMIELVKECDKRGMDVIIDLVLNHTSNLNQWFKNAVEAVKAQDYENKYVKYYSIVKGSDRESGKTYKLISNDYYYECNFDSSMPELDLSNEEVKDEIEAIVKYWLVDVGVHGFRLDAVKYYFLNDNTKNIAFLKWLKNVCEKYENDCYLVGEDWSSDLEIQSYYAAINCFNFGMAQQEGAIASCAKTVDSVSSYIRYLAYMKTSCEEANSNAIMTPFISNHDMDRAAGYLNLSDFEMQMAANLYLLSPGSPFIYYGEEIGMKGARGTENTDANRRLAMLWGDNDTVKDPVGATYDSSYQTNGTVKTEKNKENSLYSYYKSLIMIRKLNPEIALGTYTALSFNNFNFGGFLATYEDKTVGVFHNTSYTDTLVIDLKAATDFQFTKVAQYIGKGSASLKDGRTLTIAPRTSVVLR